MTDLFTSAGVDVPQTPKGMAYPATYQAARLLGMVEGLSYSVFEDDYGVRCEVVARYAEKIGAHSVARAVRWALASDDSGRHDYCHVRHHMEKAAKRYLARVEAKRLEAWKR